jgi:SAM-dependent methyltransferase
VFDLGDQPFANGFLTREQLGEPESRYPLSLRECSRCGMIQLSHVASPSALFKDYAFQTGSSQGMARHFAKLMRENIERHVPPTGLVVEIGSNDGTALASIPRDGRCRRLGIDPAENLATIARKQNVPCVAGFFTETLAEEVRQSHGPASLIVACNVLGHVDDLDDVCRGVAALLSKDGALVLEVPYANWMISRTEFDTIYHEHLSYFEIRPLATLFHRHGMRVTRVEPQDVHGGSVRLTVQHGQGRGGQVSPWLDGELLSRDWTAFGKRCEESRRNLTGWLTRAKDEGRTVIGYGAPAKSTVRLNYCGIGTDLLPMVVDSTPGKQGRFIPGTHQPVMPPSAIEEHHPTDVLVLAWNHLREITGKLSGHAASGGRVLSAINL